MGSFVVRDECAACILLCLAGVCLATVRSITTANTAVKSLLDKALGQGQWLEWDFALGLLCFVLFDLAFVVHLCACVRRQTPGNPGEAGRGLQSHYTRRKDG